MERVINLIGDISVSLASSCELKKYGSVRFDTKSAILVFIMTTPFCVVIRNNLQSGDIIDQGAGEKQGRWAVRRDKTGISSRAKLLAEKTHLYAFYD